MRKIISSLIQLLRKRKLSSCGMRVRVGKNCDFQGHVNIANDVSLGDGCRLVSTIASINIEHHVIIAPDVTIYSGDHRFDVLGSYISEIDDSMKSVNNDKDVLIEYDSWIGTKAIILKGVTIGHGSIIGAGAVVTKNIPPYSIVTGVPSQKIRPRFSEEEIERHEDLLLKK